MKWTKTTPTEQGWYWVMVDDELQMAEIYETCGNSLRICTTGGSDDPMKSWEGHDAGYLWYGPIAPPPVEDLVKCNRAGDLDSCDACGHAEPHERLELTPDPYVYRACSAWHRCDDGWHPAIKVRCVRVNGDITKPEKQETAE